MTPQETLGQRLRRARLAAGFEQEQAAAAVDRHRNTIGRWEADEGRGPSELELSKLAQLYGTTIAELHGESVSRVRESVSAAYRNPIPATARALVHHFTAHLAESHVSEDEIERARDVLFGVAGYLSEPALGLPDEIVLDQLRQLSILITESLAARQKFMGNKIVDLIDALRAKYDSETDSTSERSLADLEVRRREKVEPTNARTATTKRGRR